MIEKLNPHYSFTTPATVHDEEALTTLELVGRTTAKLNEVVDAQNTLKRNTESVLENQNEHIKKIREETVPEDVSKEVQKRIEDGSFDESINHYSGDLTAQVTNLLSQIPNAPTTMDAEIIDGRIDSRNYDFKTFGEMVRTNQKIVQPIIGDLVEVDAVIVLNELYDITKNSAVSSTTGQWASYELRGEKALALSGKCYPATWQYPLAHFYDANGEQIMSVGHRDGEKNYSDFIVGVPSNAVRIIVNGHNRDAQVKIKTVIEKSQAKLTRDIADPTNFSGYIPTGEVTVLVDVMKHHSHKLYAQIYSDTGGLKTGVGSDYVMSTVYIPISEKWLSINPKQFRVGVFGGAFVDADFNWISPIKTDYPNNLTIYPIPQNARYVGLTVKENEYYGHLYVTMMGYELLGLKRSNKFGKKIVWLGTSTSYGANAKKSYPLECAAHCGFELVNCSIPGMSIHTDNGGLRNGRSLSMSIAEYENNGVTIESNPMPYIPGGGYNSYYFTWENIFNEENSDTDLFVYDVAPNNGNWSTADWDAFDHANWCYKDGSSFESHRNTFLGALLFLMDKMYACKPDARMVLVLGTEYSYTNAKPIMKLVSEKYHIPLIDVWSKANATPQLLSKIRISNEDHHPSDFGHTVIGEILSGELQLV